MTNWAPLTDSPAAQDWLTQFDAVDVDTAAAWIDMLTFVSADDFRIKMLGLIQSTASDITASGPIGIFVEREVRRRANKSQRAFREAPVKVSGVRKRVMRAYGKAPAIKPVDTLRTVGPELGSEAVLGQLVTQLTRSVKRFVFHPGPDTIRKPQRRIHTVFIVTDFIGSGTRVFSFLDAFWRIATVRSWVSLGLLRFHVLAYSGTMSGHDVVLSHPSRPKIHWVAPCETLAYLPSTFRSRVEKLCVKYDPVDSDPINSLGYGGLGTMRVFAHGCPNNSPRILHTIRKGKWRPLFRQRANLLEGSYREPPISARTRRLAALSTPNLAARLANSGINGLGAGFVMVLTALNAGIRFNNEIAARTGLELEFVAKAIIRMQEFGWVSDTLRLTTQGRLELNSANPIPLAQRWNETNIGTTVYYPTALRYPKKMA